MKNLNLTQLLKGVKREEGQLLLCESLGIRLEQLVLMEEVEMEEAQYKKLRKQLEQLRQGMPLAYILGKKNFYGRDFELSPKVLIPRPESETLIEQIKQLKVKKVLDVGTGSGCLAISVALELKDCAVTAVDKACGALEVAQKNAKKLGARNIQFLYSDLLGAKELKGRQFDLIVANLPYVDKNWPWLSESLRYEPKEALFAEEGGLALIKRLLEEAAGFLEPKGLLLLESDPSQREQILDMAQQRGWRYDERNLPNSNYSLLLARKS